MPSIPVLSALICLDFRYPPTYAFLKLVNFNTPMLLLLLFIKVPINIIIFIYFSFGFVSGKYYRILTSATLITHEYKFNFII